MAKKDQQGNAVSRGDFLNLLRQNRLTGAWLMEGEEDRLRDECLRDIRAALLAPGMEELDSAALVSPDTDTLIAACETLPFLSPMRLVVVRDQAGFSGKTEAEEALCDYVAHVPPSCLLLYPFHGAADRRKKLPKALEKLGHIVRFSRMDERELQQWIVARFAEAEKTCDPAAARELVFIAGTDSTILANEIDKIISLSEGPTVSVSLVREAATPTAEYNVFRMLDASFEGRKADAMRMLRDARVNGEDDLHLLSLFLRQYRLLQHIKIMQTEKVPQSSFAQLLSIQGFQADKLVRQAARVSNRQVKQSLALCLDTEYRIKAGELSAKGSMETLMLKLFQQ